MTKYANVKNRTTSAIYQTKTGTVCITSTAPAIAMITPKSFKRIRLSLNTTTRIYSMFPKRVSCKNNFSFRLNYGKMNSSKGARLLLYRLETAAGTISIEKTVIGKIIAEAVAKFNGKVLISNHKGKAISGFAARIGMMDDISSMEIVLGKTGLDIRFYILIRFGTSINRVTEQLIETIKYNTEEITGIEVNSIALVVTGMISKQTVRRNIEVRG